MTRSAFLTLFAQALVILRPEVLPSTPPIYPSGPLIRLKVHSPWHTRVPPLVDPIGLIWMAQHGRLHGVNQSHLMATAGLGMSPSMALDVVQAVDYQAGGLTGEQQAWRLAILDVLEAYRTDVVSPRNSTDL